MMVGTSAKKKKSDCRCGRREVRERESVSRASGAAEGVASSTAAAPPAGRPAPTRPELEVRPDLRAAAADAYQQAEKDADEQRNARLANPHHAPLRQRLAYDDRQPQQYDLRLMKARRASARASARGLQTAAAATRGRVGATG